MNQHIKRLRLLPLTVTVMSLTLAMSIASAHPALAHAATHSGAVAPQQITMTINGQVYHTTSGGVVRLPTTYPDGSKGWIDFTAGTVGNSDLAATHVIPDTTSCTTAYATQTGRNVLGGEIYHFTLSQYWCYNGTAIQSYNQPGDSYASYNGWSLAEQSTMLEGVNPAMGDSRSFWRFNGPFGVGCKSGRNEIFWYGTGMHTNQFDTNSYFGC